MICNYITYLGCSGDMGRRGGGVLRGLFSDIFVFIADIEVGVWWHAMRALLLHYSHRN